MSHQANNINPTAMFKNQPWELCGLLIGTIALSGSIILGNPNDISLWLLALLVIGITQALLFPFPYSFIGGVAVTAGWVLLRQNADLWIDVDSTQNLLELTALAANIVMTIAYRQRWSQQRGEVSKLQALRDLLVEGENDMGLVSRSVAELRLLEEMERADSSKQSIGLLLMNIERINRDSVSDHDFQQASQAIIRKLVSAARVYDLPFQAADDSIGIILPERKQTSLREDTLALCRAARNTTFLNQSGQPKPVVNYIRLGIGWGTNEKHSIALDMIRMAESSLIANRIPNSPPKSVLAQAYQYDTNGHPLHVLA